MKVLIAGNVHGDFIALKLIIDGLFAKGKVFDLVICCGQTLSNSLALPTDGMPCKTVFVDSSETGALLMNSGKD